MQGEGMESRRRRESGEEGYLLLWLVVATFLLLLALAVAAPRVAKALERDREEESVRRAEQYVRAIRLYYNRTHTWPTSVDQLEKSNEIRYLRKRYKDPLTGDDYRLIPFGQAKTEVKDFFGEPFAGTASGSLGSLAGSVSDLGNNTAGGQQTGVGQQSGGAGSLGAGSGIGATGGIGSSAGIGGGFSLGNNPVSGGTGSSGTGAGTNSAAQGASSDGGSAVNPFGAGSASGPGSSGGLQSVNASDFKGSSPPFVGVGSTKKGTAIIEWNGSKNIEDWEFLYDPRTEVKRKTVSLFGGAPATGSIGSNPASSFGGSTNGTGGAGQTAGQGTGQATGQGAGQTDGSGQPSGTAPGTSQPGTGQQPAPQQ